MQAFELLILKKDGTKYWSEGFPTRAALNKWLDTEKTRPYWQKEWTVEITDNTAELKRIEDELRVEREAAEKAKKDRVDMIKDEFKKKPKTIAEVVLLLEKIAEHLGIDLKP